MFQLDLLSGKQAGTFAVTRHFPFWIGRAPDADLSVTDDGVWDWHLAIGLSSGEGATLATHESAMATVNGQPMRQTRLRNGDVIGLGALQIRFGLSPARLRSLRLRELITWLTLGALCLVQVGLIYGLLA